MKVRIYRVGFATFIETNTLSKDMSQHLETWHNISHCFLLNFVRETVGPFWQLNRAQFFISCNTMIPEFTPRARVIVVDPKDRD